VSGFEAIQALVLAAILAYSLVVALRKLAPQATRRWLGRVSARLDTRGRARLVRRLGHMLQPKEARSGACGDGDGCGTCRGCVPMPEVTASPPMPLDLRARNKD